MPFRGQPGKENSPVITGTLSLSRGWVPGLRWLCLGVMTLFALAARGHNLDMQTDYLGFDKVTLEMFQARAAAGQSLLQVGDTVGLLMKATPNLGTPTGAGGYSTFFIPVGSQVVQAEYGHIDTSTGYFTPTAVKGQSILALGDGARGAKQTTGLIGLQLGPNINGQTAPAVDASGYANGTMVGVYSDTGIFYSTDPKTAWQSWVNTGGLDNNINTTSDNTLTASSGRVVVPTTRWDAEQLLAFGSSSPAAIVDAGDERGNAPWGMASAVAGPECGYAWCFDKTFWDGHPNNPNRMKLSVAVGPWRRIQYDGSASSKDTPGLRSTVTGYANVDASSVGYALSPANPLPATTSWADKTSPKAVRIAWGNTELYRPEYARVQIKILVGQAQAGSPFNTAGFLQAYADTFGGDAGGEYNNFDHLWHYYRPTTATLSGKPFVFKQASKPLVTTGETFTYNLWLINFGSTTLTNVKLQDLLPSGEQFISASPAQSSGPNPLVWNFVSMAPQSMKQVTVTVKATGSGVLTNTATSSSDQYAPETTTDTVTSGSLPLLYADKTVTPVDAQPGDTVAYTIIIKNQGTAASAVPLTINERLPSGFSYNSLVSATVNGVMPTAGNLTVAVPSAGKPVFTLNQAINAGQSLLLTFKVRISPAELPGKYYNSYSFTNNGKVDSTGPIALVTVGNINLGLGNLVFFDVNGDGHYNAGEGVPGVSLELYAENMTAGVDSPLATTVSDASGLYLFDHLDPGAYYVHIPAANFQSGGPLFGKVAIAATLFGDDDVGQDGLNTTDPPTQGVSCKLVYLYPGQAPTGDNGETGVNSASDDNNDASVDLTVDFGFQIPVGLGNLVFIDSNHNGHADPGEGVGGVTVEIYAADQPPGVGQYLFSTSTTADGHYLFEHLSTGDYIVHIPAVNFQFGHPLYGLLSVFDTNVPEHSDDDVGENGVDAISPIYTGISSGTVHLEPGQAPVDAAPGSTSGETGFLASEDNANDSKIDLTIDFGFTDLPSPVVGVGNLVFKDTNGNLFYDDGEGVDDVVLQLFPATVTDPLHTTPLKTTTSASGGEYYFGNLQPGDYFVFIPPSNFINGGVLQNALSIPGQGGDDGLDDDQDENGDDPVDPAATGVKSNIFHLAVGAEPTGFDSESGFRSYVDDGTDANNDLTIDFGFFCPVGVGNVVFKDANGNGRYDAGEGVDGVTVQLFLPGDDPQVAVPQAVTTTANGGRYSFTRLNAGSYFIFIPGSQFVFGGPLSSLLSVPDTTTSATGDDDVGEDGIDSVNPAATGIASRVFTLTPGLLPTDADTETGVGAADDNDADGNFDATIDFGFYDPGIPILGVGNVVFIDLNHNGRYDAGEGVANIRVQLFHAGDNPLSAPPYASALTDANGAYLLRTNVAGDYIVFIPPATFETGHPLYGLMSLPGNGVDDQKDDDMDENGIDSAHPDITGIASATIHLAAGAEPTAATGETGFQSANDDAADSNYNLTVDFGFDHICPTFVITPASLPGAYLGATYSQTLATTSGYGPYTWDVAAGTLPTGFSLDASGAIDGIAGELGTFNFTARVTDFTGCQGTVNCQIVISPVPTVSIGNCVYIDLNHNGFNDGNEGVGNVEVELFHAGDNPTIDGPVAEMDTDASGLYLFTGLDAGDYFVYIPASEFAVGMPLYGCLSIAGVSGDDGVDDNAPNNDNGIDDPHPEFNGIASVVVHLEPGTEPTDAGTEKGAGAAMDNANDANSDLTIDLGFDAQCGTMVLSPASLPAATLGTAYSQAVLASGGIGASTFTLASGSLPPGITLSAAGTLSGTPSDKGSYVFVVHATDTSGCSAESTLTLVVNGKLAVGNLVFFDANANGHADVGEGIDGVTVELYRSTDTPGTSTPLASAITAGGGLYLIDNLTPGDYVLFVPKAMFATGAPLAGMKSVSGAQVSGDDDVGEKGLDAADPAASGVATNVFTLGAGTSPTGLDYETGINNTSDDARDEDVDLTQDFGFVDKNAQAPTFAAWADSYNLSGTSAGATANPDGDAFRNLIEYAFGLNPTSGAESLGAVFNVTRNTGTGGVDIRVRRRHGGLNDLTFTLQLLPSLTTPSWTSSTISPTITNNADGTETLTLASVNTDPVLTGTTDGLARIHVSLDANHNGTPEAADNSPVLGWQRRTLTTQNQTYCAPFLADAVYTGTVSGVSGSSVTLGSTGSGLNALFVAGYEYYLDVISGSEQGQRWEINEAGSSGSTLLLDPTQDRSTQTSVPFDLASDVVAIRPHWRMADLFQPADYHATNSSSSADQILFYDQPSGGYITLWLANYFSQAHWHQVGVASLNTTEDARVVSPADSVFARPRVGSVSAFAAGQLRTWKFALPLKKGTTFFGNPYPVAQSPRTWSMTASGGFTASATTNSADRIYFWNGDTSATATGYTTYQLYKAGISDFWKVVGSTDLTTDYGLQTLFSNCHGGFINSAKGLSTWVIPAPVVP